VRFKVIRVLVIKLQVC